jgi:formate-dependent nitrite reductase membrane component NrfD
MSEEQRMTTPPNDRGFYGRNESRRNKGQRDQPIKIYEGETYYGRPVLKEPSWGWLITIYFFIGGIAGASQIIATIADLFGGKNDRRVVRAGRYTALVGAMLSPIFLIADLHTPQRWFNMLRIFRKTSAMSIGSWTLAIFGALSGLVAAGQALDDLFGLRAGRWLARLFGIPAALAGMMMSVYTGVLLSATSVPLWAAAYKRLPALFGVSAMATGSSMLSLILAISGAPKSVLRRIERLALIANLTESVLSVAVEQEWKRQELETPVKQPPLDSAHRFGEQGLGIAVPILLRTINMLFGRGSRTLTMGAAISTLIGGFTQRTVMVFAGRKSALRPEDYFRFTQPGAPTAGEGRISMAGEQR